MSKGAETQLMGVSGRVSTSLLTLDTKTTLLAGSQIATQVVSGTLISTKVVYTVRNPDADDGPFLCGVAVNGMSVAEVEAWIGNNGPVGPEHSTLTEIASRGRHIRVFGLLESEGSNATQTYAQMFAEHVKLGWTKADAGWIYWIHNLGAQLTTGSTWDVQEFSFVKYDK